MTWTTLRNIGHWILTTVIMTKARPLSGGYRRVALVFGGLIAFFYFYTSGFGIFSPSSHRGVFFGGTLAAVYLWFPALKKSPENRYTIVDILLALLSLGLGLYFTYNYSHFAERIGEWTPMEIGCGLLAVILSLEGARRAVGLLLPVLGLVSLLYAHQSIAQNLPLIIAHRGFDIKRIGAFMFTSLDAIFGTVDYTLATYVMPFIIFGAFLEKSGVGKFFIDLTYAVMGRSPSGTAQVAVIGSALMGSISGSPVANVVATGNFTIPLMKKTGYNPNVSGAIESCASTGGMFTPPVMGAAAFFMVEFTGIPYIEILKIAAIPAVIYYLSVGTMVWLQAKKSDLGGIRDEDVPRPLEVIKEGWFLVIPLILLLYLLIQGYSPNFAAFYSGLACLVVSWFTRNNKMKIHDILQTFSLAGKNVLMIASITGVIGVMVGILNLTGLGLKLSQIILALSQGNLLLTIVLVGVAAFLLGMGSPIAAVYVILAVIAPAAMVELGVPVIAAHLLLIWYSQLSGLTPPVCLVSYAAAAIAGGDPFRTGILSMKYGFSLLLIPILFIYTPLLLTGTPFQNTVAVITAAVAVVGCAFFIQRYFLRRNSWIEQILFGAGSFLLFTNHMSWNLAGIILLLIPVIMQVSEKRRASTVESAS